MAHDRIVSLVPSITELVCWLGVADRVVGRTRFCTEPAGTVDEIPIIGGTKNPHVERIVGLRPSLVIANREENRKEDVEALRNAGLDVLLTDPNTVPDACAMVRDLGERLGRAEKAESLAVEIESAMGQKAPGARPRVFVAVWREPLMGLGGESFGHDMVERAGGLNVLADRPRYPEVTLAEVAAVRPGLILLPDEPYPFTERHVAEFAAIAPTRVVDGKLLWWYGPRMPDALRELRRLFEESVGS